MENVSVATLKQQIRVALDENHVSTELANLQDTDTLTLDELIESKIEDAADAVIRSAPIDMLSDIGELLSGDISTSVTAPYVVTMFLPSDFLRLIRFKLSAWKYAVHEVATPTQETLAKLYSPYGVCGTVDRPVVLISPHRESTTVQGVTSTRSGLKLEAFSGNESSNTLDNCLYAKKPTITTTTQNNTTIQNIQLGDRLKRPTVYYAAFLVASVVGEEKAAEKLFAVCKEMLNLE